MRSNLYESVVTSMSSISTRVYSYWFLGIITFFLNVYILENIQLLSEKVVDLVFKEMLCDLTPFFPKNRLFSKIDFPVLSLPQTYNKVLGNLLNLSMKNLYLTISSVITNSPLIIIFLLMSYFHNLKVNPSKYKLKIA